jgi:hypothetical protein
MKFLFALLAVTLFGAVSLHAAPSNAARIDVASISPHKVPLSPGVANGGKLYNSSSTNTILRSSFPAGKEWKEASFIFNPEADGSLYINLMGAWAKNPDDRSWIIYDNVTVKGATITNGDFEKGMKSWWQGSSAKGAKIVDGGREGGQKAVRVNHDNGACTRFDVKKDQPVTITFFYKLAD